MRFLSLVGLAVFSLIFPTWGHAADRPRWEKVAKKACAAGDFRKGVEILAELYVDTDDPTYIYNQGRCYEQNHQWVGAIDRFREYLRKSGDLTASERSDVEKHLVECESFREREDPKVAAVPSTPPPPAPLALPPSPSPQPPDPGSTAAEQPRVRDTGRGSGLRLTGILVGSLGLVAGATGLVLNLKANSLAEDFNKTQDPAIRSSQSSYKTGSVICYGAAAGALLAGVVLYLFGRSVADEKAAQVSMSPVWTPAGFSLEVGGAF